ncbi:Protein of unknown function [Ruaniaceae bacterium KH17]|nr:Protein of unknown function [Ruaniaceae bacterium KH17]
MSFLKFMSSPAGRIGRAAVGAGLLAWAIVAGGWVWVLGALGVVFIAAGALDFCPLALLFGKPMAGAKLRAL